MADRDEDTTMLTKSIIPHLREVVAAERAHYLFIVDGPDRPFTLVGIGRALRADMHRGSAYNVDPCKALFAAMNGVASTTRVDFDDGEERIGVSFPQEWLRDPDSPWLRDYPVDLPWEEPELIEAMIAWRG